MSLDPSTLDAFRRNVLDRLLHERHLDGHWVGELSSSALSTATATCALKLYREDRAACSSCNRHELESLISGGVAWLVSHRNEDGGWGDTANSPSNISTTLLCWAALTLCQQDLNDETDARQRCERWLLDRVPTLTPEHIANAICEVYGVDKTFSAPILTMCAICGCFDDPQDAWRRVPALPFELALVPHGWFHRLGLPVVSYALPALIAIGQARHHHRPTRNPITRLVRHLARRRTLDALICMQPQSGGYLEATPITSFVTMSLISVGRSDHPTARAGIRFLVDSVREDGSWPIDTNLATWTTTLAVNAMYSGGDGDTVLAPKDRRAVINWLLDQQHTAVHPYTDAAPGGWAWTDLSGGVPDADDTPGALLALAHLVESEDDVDLIERTTVAAANAIRWLLDLQNRDGGIPTFCRGWGKLPFDRSSPDLTAHTLRAWQAWRTKMPSSLRHRLDRAVGNAIQFLIHAQRPDGAWVPLWFGHQAQASLENPVYGTGRVLMASGCQRNDEVLPKQWGSATTRARAWILAAQSEDGGWGGDRGIASSIEETAVAVEALATCMYTSATDQMVTDAGVFDDSNKAASAVARGIAWLQDATASGTAYPASPIGLYFAKLWYSERLYPIIFTAAALGRVSRLAPPHANSVPDTQRLADSSTTLSE